MNVAALVDEPNKIYFLGSRGVGKSTLVRTLLNKEFNEKISPSPTQITIAKYEIEKKKFTFKDLTDKNDFRLTKLFINEIEDVKCLFCLFSLTDKSSFEYAKTVLGLTCENLRNNSDIILVLAGNKYDLVEENPTQRQVKEEDIQNYISSTLPGALYFDISCKSGYNINKIKDTINELEISSPEEEDEQEEEQEKKEKKSHFSCVIY